MIVSGCSESVSTREPPARSTTGDTVTHLALQRPVILFESRDQNPLGKRQPARLYRTSTVAGCFGPSAPSLGSQERARKGAAPPIGVVHGASAPQNPGPSMRPALSAKLVLISVKVKLAALAGPLSDRIAAAAVVGGNAFIFRPSSVLMPMAYLDAGLDWREDESAERVCRRVGRSEPTQIGEDGEADDDPCADQNE